MNLRRRSHRHLPKPHDRVSIKIAQLLASAIAITTHHTLHLRNQTQSISSDPRPISLSILERERRNPHGRLSNGRIAALLRKIPTIGPTTQNLRANFLITHVHADGAFIAACIPKVGPLEVILLAWADFDLFFELVVVRPTVGRELQPEVCLRAGLDFARRAGIGEVACEDPGVVAAVARVAEVAVFDAVKIARWRIVAFALPTIF